jgi:hypothetical protein
MANVNLYTKFDYTDAAGNVYSDGSVTTAKTITVANGYIFDRTYVISDPSTITEILSDSLIATFDFLWIESDQFGEIQLVCNEDGVIGGSNLENAWVVKLAANIPFVLHNDDSRNRGDMAATVNASNYAAEIDTWETNWAADTIDRIEFYSAVGTTTKVRVFAVG